MLKELVIGKPQAKFKTNTFIPSGISEFKGFYNEENVDLKTQFDVTQFDKIYLPVQDRMILHPYSDQDVCQGTMRCLNPHIPDDLTELA